MYTVARKHRKTYSAPRPSYNAGLSKFSARTDRQEIRSVLQGKTSNIVQTSSIKEKINPHIGLRSANDKTIQRFTKVGPFFTKNGKWLSQKDIDTAVEFNTRYTWMNRHNILAYHIGTNYTYTDMFEEALAMGIANWQEKRGGLRIDGQFGWNSLARLAWLLIRNRKYDDVSDAIKIVVDGLDYNVAKINYIVYNKNLNSNYKIVSLGKIEIGNKALKNYTSFRLALQNSIRLASNPKKPIPEFKSKSPSWDYSNEKEDRKRIEKFAKAPSAYNRSRLNFEQKIFVKWCYNTVGEHPITLLTYLKNSGYKVTTWPNSTFPYTVTIEGPRLKLKNESWLLWPTKVKNTVMNIEPRIQSAKLYSWHVALNLAQGKVIAMPSEMTDLISRYSGYSKGNTIFDERLFTIESLSTNKPTYPKWRNLSAEMRTCWFAAAKKGKSDMRGISAFSDCAYRLHLRIVGGLVEADKRSKHYSTMHAYKALRWKLKRMCDNKSTALYSYRRLLGR